MSGDSDSDPGRRIPDGPKIRRLRLDRGWTQVDLANAAAYCERAIRNPEKGRPATTRLLAAIAQALDTTLEEICLPAPHSPPVPPGLAADSGPDEGEPWEDRCSIGHMPVTGRVFGRQRELDELDAAYGDPRVKIVIVVGAPGAGKSALVNAWLQRRRAGQQVPKTPIYAWSFFVQEQSGDVVSDAVFVESALRWFRDRHAADPSLEYRGRRLAEKVKQHGAILVLDGLEGLQQPDDGRIKQDALALHVLLGDLAAMDSDSRGFCVITTCLNVDDLSRYEPGAVMVLELGNLAPADGAQVLRDKGVQGTDGELAEAAEAVEGHCLSLALLGGCLADAYEGDVSFWSRVVEVGAGGNPAEQVMRHYEHMLGQRKRLAVLRLLALFDGPVDQEAVRALCGPPLVPGLNDLLQAMADESWARVVNFLRKAHLLLDKDPDHPAWLNTHHVVRMYFREQLRRDRPEAWLAGNARLFEQFTGIARGLPERAENLDEMMRFIMAVKHGCRAAKYREAFDLYYRRIACGEQSRLKNVFCEVREDLQILSLFFRSQWDQPVEELDAANQTLLLCNAGLVLRAHGRLAEAEKALLRALEIDFGAALWSGAARDARHLAQLYLVSGRLAEAEEMAQSAVEFVKDRPKPSGQLIPSLATLADVLHHRGRYDEARQIFDELETVHRRNQPDNPNIYQLSGFRYCEFLLTDRCPDKAIERAGEMIEYQEQNQVFHLAAALGKLALGCAIMAKKAGDPADARRPIESAIEGLQRAAQRDQLPRGLIARARLRQVLGDLPGAEADLVEALAIATRGGMRLHEADCHLAFARLYRDTGRQDDFQQHFRAARDMIVQMGYHRRDRQLLQLEGDRALGQPR